MEMKRYIRQKIKKLRGFIKRSDFLFWLRRSFVDHDLQREKKAMKTSSVKSPQTVRNEIEAYRRYWKCHPDDYIRYGLFRKQLTIDEILDYVPMHYYYCNFYTALYSDIWSKDKDAENKLAQYRKFRGRGIDVPEVVGVLRNGRLLTADEKEEITFENIASKMHDGERLFIKPFGGNCGVGIVTLDKRDGNLWSGDREVKTLSDMNLESATDYIFQRQLIQAKCVADINGSTLNTLRTIVTYFNGKPEIVGIILRIGRAHSFVDNSGQGGISVAVDPETGRFAPYAGREHGGGIFEKHPDTGYVFGNGGIDNWPEVRKSIYDIISRVTEYPMLGWDLAVGADNRVYAIEYNLGFGIEHAQTIMGGLRRRLSIDKRISR